MIFDKKVNFSIFPYFLKETCNFVAQQHFEIPIFHPTILAD